MGEEVGGEVVSAVHCPTLYTNLTKRKIMKQLKLILLLCICSQGLYAQNPLGLRGVRYYYSTPTIGTFGSNIKNFKTLKIVESDNYYLFSGYSNVGVWAFASLLKINAENNEIVWDYTSENESISNGISVNNSGQSLLAFRDEEQDLTQSVRINQDGTFTENYYSHDSSYIHTYSYDRCNAEFNIASGQKNVGGFLGTTIKPYGFPYLQKFNNQGNLFDSIQLPMQELSHNLMVEYGLALKTFSHQNNFVTFGKIMRLAYENSNQLKWRPVIWMFSPEDSVHLSKDLYEGYQGNYNSVLSEDLNFIDGENNEYAALFTREGNPDPLKLILCFIDSNLTVQWEKVIGTSSTSSNIYDIQDVKFDADSGFIYVCGNLYNSSLTLTKQFIAKYRKNGTIIFYKYFTIDSNIDNSITAMKILNDGDLLFAGRGVSNNGTRYFFTYRTDPDGYDPDGQYLDIKEVTVTPTEIGIFPNPSDGVFQVSSLSEEPMHITILDQQGKQVAVFELNELSSDNSFDMSEQATGVYFAHISQGEQQWVKKLVVR